MKHRYAVSFVLEAHLPFIREFSGAEDLEQSGEEGRFFEYISETLLPLLGLMDRLENDNVPFRIGLVFSPILCGMLNDTHLQDKYLYYIDKQIAFGKKEIERTCDQPDVKKLAVLQHDILIDKKNAYTQRYEKNLLKAFDYYRRGGKAEILASSATHVFFPFIAHNKESLQAQFEVSHPVYRRNFGNIPQGLWLSALGWTPLIEPFLSAYNYTYTIVDSHGLLYGEPLPKKGCFFPVRTNNNTLVFARDFYAVKKIDHIKDCDLYMDTDRDAGYELSKEIVKPFIYAKGKRRKTGYKYWSRSGRVRDEIYNSQTASEKAAEHARMFLEDTVSRLEEVSNYMEDPPISLYANNADFFGSSWHEGFVFLESVFRLAVNFKKLYFVNPAEFIANQKIASFQSVKPEFSSWGANGYGETWLNTSNDWIYRHLVRSMERMTELAERFPDDTGLKERALNQAAREILLAQSSDWPGMLYKQDSTEYARINAENALRNFTTIYEALGSNYISTEWLTTLERRHNIFPNINYRVFRRKK